MTHAPSELRQDIVTGDWIVVATGRAKRPQDFLIRKSPVLKQHKSTCPFETLHEKRILVFGRAGEKSDKDWSVQVVPNKYPAFGEGACAEIYRKGVYSWTEGVGFHEIVITRDHVRALAELDTDTVNLVIRAYQERYDSMKNNPYVRYISIFHNHGKEAGASVSHPHWQIIALPVIPPHIEQSLRGSLRYFREEKKCAHCVIIDHEIKMGECIIYENNEYVALAPFASRTAFEIRIFPKRHNPRFEEITPKERLSYAEAMRVSLLKLHKGLKNPDYNFFFHTAPPKAEKESGHYHWHCEILPKTQIWAGFEIGTGIEISTIAPEHAAEFLRSVRI